MAECIERDMLCRVLERCRKAPKNRYQRGVEDGMELALNAVKAIHTADVAPVVHGRWLHSGYEEYSGHLALVKCSRCSHEAYAIACYVREGNYCPYCGARMDGGAGDEP